MGDHFPATAATPKNPNNHKIRRPNDDDQLNNLDFISSLPIEILHHILSSVPTKFAIRTSVLSKRWKQIWSETPCLSFVNVTPSSISQTLSHYNKALEMTRFDIKTERDTHVPDIDSWIDFAVSHKVENLSMTLGLHHFKKNYSLPDSFFINSSLKQLKLELYNMFKITPRCKVSWTSLRSLSLTKCNLLDDSIGVILSGCPLLESLRLIICFLGGCLDLSVLLNLTRLELFYFSGPGRLELVAPHIKYLKVRNSLEQEFSFVNVSSVTEAFLDISNFKYAPLELEDNCRRVQMLEKLHNVERLTLGDTLVQMLSLAELHGVPFPTLKIHTLIIRTMGFPSGIPGIATLLQNSPGLKKIIVTISRRSYLRDEAFNKYLHSNGLNPEQCWRSKYGISPYSKAMYNSAPYSKAMYHSALNKNDAAKHLALFLEVVLRNTKTLEEVVVKLGCGDTTWFGQQLQMVQTLSHRNNVSIVLKRIATK